MFLLLALFIVGAVVFYYWRQTQFLNMSRKRVLITGSATGFGNMLAKHLDQLGVRVYAGCVNQSYADLLRGETSSRVKTFVLDVTDQASIDQMFDFVSYDLDGEPLWAIVNNAAIPAPLIPFDWSQIEDYKTVLDVNLLGVVRACLAFLPLIKRGREGRIVNISSINGRFNIMSNAYGLSKYALEAFSDGLTFELKPFNITVHTLQPGMFKTNMANPDMHCKVVEDKWEVLSPKIKSEYGHNYLNQRITSIRTLFKQQTLVDLSPVIEAHMHALFARYPHNRYLVGWNAKFFLPFTWLPFPVLATILPVLQQLMGAAEPAPKPSNAN